MIWPTALKGLLVTGLLLPLTACHFMEKKDGPPLLPRSVHKIPDAVPKHEPRAAYGNPPTYQVWGKQYTTLKSSRGYKERGLASWYGTKFHGKRTSSGEPYDIYRMTAAHRTLPLPTYAKVTNLKNRQSVIVKINDRGPFHSDRLLDLSYAAARKLGIYGAGTGHVEIEALEPAGTPLLSSSATPKPASKHYYIQLGAFSHRPNAEYLAKKLSSFGQTQVQAPSQGQAALFKVLVGPFTEVLEATQLQKKLAQSTHSPAILVARD